MLALLLGPSIGLAPSGRCEQRSNLLPADLSLTPVAYLMYAPGDLLRDILVPHQRQPSVVQIRS
ncbi:hypothetical protein CV761_04030 [Salmonella enterica subsp. enterica serovar Typhi]|nr:hypothetical protein CV761_04030 [Salmonella enterica subsp. enterica serovar Typhi]